MMNDYSDAYSEVSEILRHVPKQEYEKIPKKFIRMIESQKNEKNTFVYNIALPFDKQNISKDAKLILAIIYRNCWAFMKKINN